MVETRDTPCIRSDTHTSNMGRDVEICSKVSEIAVNTRRCVPMLVNSINFKFLKTVPLPKILGQHQLEFCLRTLQKCVDLFPFPDKGK
jgi:hypothetical protein